jgi:DNA repair protein RadC
MTKKIIIRYICQDQTEDVTYLHSPKDASQYVIDLMDRMPADEKKKEMVWTIGVNSRNRVIYSILEGVGLLDSSLMSPETIFRNAFIREARSIFVIHTHPSGILKPSDDDIRITNRLKSAGDILGIRILDHIIVADPKNPDLVRDGNSEHPYYSFAEHHLL